MTYIYLFINVPDFMLNDKGYRDFKKYNGKSLYLLLFCGPKAL